VAVISLVIFFCLSSFALLVIDAGDNSSTLAILSGVLCGLALAGLSWQGWRGSRSGDFEKTMIRMGIFGAAKFLLLIAYSLAAVYYKSAILMAIGSVFLVYILTLAVFLIVQAKRAFKHLRQERIVGLR